MDNPYGAKRLTPVPVFKLRTAGNVINKMLFAQDGAVNFNGFLLEAGVLKNHN